MGFLSWFSGGGKQVDKVTDAVINGLDAVFYTDEEKAGDAKKRAEIWYKFMELARNESSIKSVTRRVIAILVISHWLIFLNVALVSHLVGNEPGALFAFGLAKAMLWIVGGVGAFYFGTHLLSGIKK